MRKNYDRDISRAQFKKIEALLEGVRNPVKLICMMFFVEFCMYLKRCYRRMLASDFPKWQSI